MTDRELDQILQQKAQALHPVDPALLDRVAVSIQSSLAPVRPLPRAWVLRIGLVLIAAFAAIAGAARLGFHGIEKLGAWERAAIFPTLAILLWLAATAFVAEMIPGSRRRVAPAILLSAATMALLAVFAILFHDYSTAGFVHQGIVCLSAGLAFALPTGLASWWLLRRGFAVNPASAGRVAGTLAGLAGLAMLELHCPNFNALHLLVWHTGVILVSAGLAAFLARAASLRRGITRPR